MNEASPALEPSTEVLAISERVQAGTLSGARQAAEALLQTSPEDYYALHLAGVIALHENRPEAALELFRRALAHAPDKPNEAMSWNGAGQAMLALRQQDRACEMFRRAIQTDPQHAQHAMDFAQVLADTGKLALAEEVLRTAMQRQPQDPGPCARLAGIWIKHGRQQDALAMLDMAKCCDPNYAPTYVNASIALAMLGKTDAAYVACNAALMLDPSLACYYQLAGLGEISDEQLHTLQQRAAENSTASVDARIDAGFALAVVYARRDAYDDAFEQLQRANRLKHDTLAFDAANAAERVRYLKAFFVPSLFERLSGKLQSPLKPVFIVGMPRSGSTLIEQMLAAHSQVQAGGELAYLPEICHAVGETWGTRGSESPGTDAQVIADLTQACEQYTQRTAHLRRRRQRFTDKLLGNYHMLGMIQLMFPQAVIIHTRRDPFDTCLSCYEHLFTSPLNFTYDLHDLGTQYRLYEELMAHWHAVLPAGRILDVNYEALVTQPEAQVRRILDHCGLPFETACLDFQAVQRPVTTASATQVRQPIYQSSVGRWRHYRSHLQPLAEALGRSLPD